MVFLCLLARGRLPDLRDVHQEVRRLRQGDPADLRRSACSCPSAPTSRCAASSSARCSASSATADGADAHARALPRPDRARSRANVTGLDRAQDPVRREVRLARGPRPTDTRSTSRRATRSSGPRSPIEVEKVLSDLYPLLRTVQPAEINQTLNALATALEGRGEEIGQNLETVDSYLKRLNPQIPALVEDLRMTSQGVRHLRRGACRRSAADPAQHRQDDRHARGPPGQAARAVHRRLGVLRHRHELPRRERRQPDPAQPGQPGRSSASSPSTPRSSPA